MRTYRAKLLLGMLLIVVALTGLGLFLAERKVAIEARLDLLQDFRNELATLHGVQDVRQAALAERCRALVSRPRIHASLEDNALDLLYPSAQDELRDILDPSDDASPETPDHALNANFYRFLDGKGALIPPPEGAEIGKLPATEEAQLAIPALNNKQQTGYLLCGKDTVSPAVHEILTMPIVSTETGEVIAALALGFKPVEFGRTAACIYPR